MSPLPQINATCSSTADCRALFPLISTECEAGMCTCLPWFGLQGLDCDSTSSASVGTMAVLGVALGLVLVTIARFGRSVWVAFARRKIKFDAAGLTYVFTSLSNLFLLVEASSLFALTFNSARGLLSLMEVAWFLAIIMLAASLVLMTITFIDMTRFVKRPKMQLAVRAVAGCFLGAISIIAAVLLGVETPAVYGEFCAVLLFLMLILNIVGPLVLYMRSARSMAKAAGRGHLGRRVLFRAFVNELVLGPKAMQDALEMDKVITYANIVTKRNSFIGGLSGPGQSESLQMLRFHSPPTADVTDPTEKLRNLLHRASAQVTKENARKREQALVEFIGRALTMAFYVSVGLFAYIGLTIAFVVLQPVEDPSPLIRLVGLVLALRIMVFSYVLYQILWFLDKKCALPSLRVFLLLTTRGARVQMRRSAWTRRATARTIAFARRCLTTLACRPPRRGAARTTRLGSTARLATAATTAASTRKKATWLWACPSSRRPLRMTSTIAPRRIRSQSR